MKGDLEKVSTSKQGTYHHDNDDHAKKTAYVPSTSRWRPHRWWQLGPMVACALGDNDAGQQDWGLKIEIHKDEHLNVLGPIIKHSEALNRPI